MKKLIFVFTLLLSTAFVSCGHSEQQDTTESTDSVVTDTVVVDTVAVDSLI
jgi:hypothetical protein